MTPQEIADQVVNGNNLAMVDFNRSAFVRLIADEIAAERERCAKLVPTNWCDPLLTGPDAPKHPLDNRGVEALLRGIQDRIRNHKE